MSVAEYPEGSSFNPGDWQTLARFWHAVARSEDIDEERPWGTRLLDVNLVLYRVDGRLTAARDFCPHRGTRLSLGKLKSERLICPYHGLEFDGRGVCTRIPGDPRATKIPPRFSNRSNRCACRSSAVSGILPRTCSRWPTASTGRRSA